MAPCFRLCSFVFPPVCFLCLGPGLCVSYFLSCFLSLSSLVSCISFYRLLSRLSDALQLRALSSITSCVYLLSESSSVPFSIVPRALLHSAFSLFHVFQRIPVCSIICSSRAFPCFSCFVNRAVKLCVSLMSRVPHVGPHCLSVAGTDRSVGL